MTRLKLAWKELVMGTMNIGKMIRVGLLMTWVKNALNIKCVSEDMEFRWATNHADRFDNCRCRQRTRSPILSDEMLWTARTVKDAPRTRSVKLERHYKAKYANIKEQSRGQRPLLLSGCLQLNLVTGSTLKTLRLSITTASTEIAFMNGSAFRTTSSQSVRLAPVTIPSDPNKDKQSRQIQADFPSWLID